MIVMMAALIIGSPSSPTCSFQNCSAFCAGLCPFRPNISASGSVQALEVYRITPNGVVDLADKDSGDIAGDLGFMLYKYITTSQCRPPYNTHECFLDDAPIVGQFRVLFDGNYGPYLKCNPSTLPDPDSPSGYNPSGRLNLSSFFCAYG